jgi:hypothetical protein
VEFGRHASRPEAEAIVARLIADGRGDASSLRVANRPISDDSSGRLLGLIVIGLVASALLAVLLVVFEH